MERLTFADQARKASASAVHSSRMISTVLIQSKISVMPKTAMPPYIDKPEPRGQTIAAVLAVGAIYLALPRNVAPAVERRFYWVAGLAVANCHCRFARADGGEPSGWKTINQSHSRVHYQWDHNPGPDRIGDFARAAVAFPPGIPIAVAAFRRTSLAHQCNRLRVMVLAIGRRRPNASAKAKKIRQHEFSFPANANSARRARRI